MLIVVALVVTAHLRQLWKLTAFAVLSSTAILSLAFLWGDPWLRLELIEEGRFLENLTAAAFLCASVGGMAFWYRTPPAVRGRDELILPLFALLAFLDETSYGGDLFGWKFPKIYGVEIDALHDFFKLGVVWLRDHLGDKGLVAAGASLALPATVAIVHFRTFLSESMAKRPALAFVLTAFAVGFPSLFFDLGFVRSGLSSAGVGTRLALLFAEELLEFEAAVVLLAGALALAPRPEDPKYRPKA